MSTTYITKHNWDMFDPKAITLAKSPHCTSDWHRYEVVADKASLGWVTGKQGAWTVHYRVTPNSGTVYRGITQHLRRDAVDAVCRESIGFHGYCR
tara:strand:+ start:1145 stop:1429 length:285 start_codon:yes stop_codon:yes gene_type:complete